MSSKVGPQRQNFGDRPLPKIVDEDMSRNNSSREDDGAESLHGYNSERLSNNDDSYFRDNQNDYDTDTIGYCSRVASDLETFNGRSDAVSVIFLFFDCGLQNLMLYLIWFAFIPTK